MEDFHKHVNIRILAGASTAIVIIARSGQGKVGHLDTTHLWVQEVAARKRAKYEKILGIANPADMMAKDVNQRATERRTEFMNACHPDGRGLIEHTKWLADCPGVPTPARLGPDMLEARRRSEDIRDLADIVEHLAFQTTDKGLVMSVDDEN